MFSFSFSNGNPLFLPLLNVAGSALVSLINPFTNKRSDIPITPGQVANIPKGWWQEEGTSDGTHLLAIFDAPYPEYILDLIY
jgi:hypothetical protein